jgi:hypothetical protein
LSWLSDRTGIHLNLRPLAAPIGAIAGGLLGGPAGAALGAGLFKTGDNLAHHDSLGHAVGQGVLNGALAYGGGKALESLRGAFAPSSAVQQAGDLMANGSTAASGSGGFGGTVRSAGAFLKENPMAASMGLQAAGNLSTAGAQNDLARAQAHRLDAENSDADYELSRKRARDAALDPIRQMLLGQFANPTKRVIAPNPYTGV